MRGSLARIVWLLIVVVSAAHVIAQGSQNGQGVALGEVLSRAGSYVDAFERQLTGIVAEETYVQDAGSLHRELKSDFLLVHVAGDAQYVEFRDVFAVDGRPVRDRQDRLTRLFLEQSTSLTAELRAIVEESARYNIGSIQRTLNTPTLPLMFLRTDNQHGAAFKFTNDTTPDLARREPSSSDFARIAPGTTVIAFQEHDRNTLIRTTGNRDLPSRGRFWIDPVTGRVLMSELLAERAQLSGEIDVRYQLEPSLELMVPAEMRERYNTFGRPTVTGRATYDHFRRFQIQTSTDIQPAR